MLNPGLLEIIERNNREHRARRQRYIAELLAQVADLSRADLELAGKAASALDAYEEDAPARLRANLAKLVEATAA